MEVTSLGHSWSFSINLLLLNVHSTNPHPPQPHCCSWERIHLDYILKINTTCSVSDVQISWTHTLQRDPARCTFYPLYTTNEIRKAIELTAAERKNPVLTLTFILLPISSCLLQTCFVTSSRVINQESASGQRELCSFSSSYLFLTRTGSLIQSMAQNYWCSWGGDWTRAILLLKPSVLLKDVLSKLLPRLQEMNMLRYTGGCCENLGLCALGTSEPWWCPRVLCFF